MSICKIKPLPPNSKEKNQIRKRNILLFPELVIKLAVHSPFAFARHSFRKNNNMAHDEGCLYIT